MDKRFLDRFRGKISLMGKLGIEHNLRLHLHAIDKTPSAGLPQLTSRIRLIRPTARRDNPNSRSQSWKRPPRASLNLSQRLDDEVAHPALRDKRFIRRRLPLYSPRIHLDNAILRTPRSQLSISTGASLRLPKSLRS